MKDAIIKLKILYRFIVESYLEWRQDVWRHNLDDYYCCDGEGCSCDAVTIREVYQVDRNKLDRAKKDLGLD